VSYQGKAQLAGVLLTTISATAPSIGASLAQLISGGSGGTPTPVATSPNSAASPSTTSSGPATFITLSDQAKAAAAARAQSDQTAADNLQAYVEAHHVNSNGTTATATNDTSTGPTGTQSTTGSKVEAIVAQIKTLASANEPQPFQPFTPTKSLSNSVTVGGYTLTLSTNASTQFYGIQLSGNGFGSFNKHFGPSDGASGGSGQWPPGVEISSGIPGNNNEAIDAITITQNTAAASSASVSSSSAGSISTSSVSAQSSSFTFLVNYATGQISVEGAAASVSVQSTRVSSPGSTLSALA
jgi:hypothetical protein